MTRSSRSCAAALGAVTVLCLSAPQDTEQGERGPSIVQDKSTSKDEVRKIIEAKIAAARELIDLRNEVMAFVPAWVESSRVGPSEVGQYTRRLIEARLLELQFRQELLVLADSRDVGAEAEPSQGEGRKEIRKIVEAKIAAANEVVALEKAALHRATVSYESGSSGSLDVCEAKVRLVEARLLVLEHRQELHRLATHTRAGATEPQGKRVPDYRDVLHGLVGRPFMLGFSDGGEAHLHMHKDGSYKVTMVGSDFVHITDKAGDQSYYPLNRVVLRIPADK